MISAAAPRRSVVANAVQGLLDPIPFGCFVAALVFDITYARSGDVMWEKGAAWLIALGLVFAIVPRLINLVQVWITSRSFATRSDKFAFWLNLSAVILAIFNMLVHTRDAYAIVPASVWLSACTVIALCVSHVVIAVQDTAAGDRP